MKKLSKRFFLGLILFLVLTCKYGFSKDVGEVDIPNFEAPIECQQEPGSIDESPLSFLEKDRNSKLAETKKDIKRESRSRLDSVSPGVTTVQTQADVRITTNTKLMDEKTVKNLTGVFNYINSTRDSIMISMNDMGKYLTLIHIQRNELLEEQVRLQQIKYRERVDRKIREAKAYRGWIGLLIISLILLLVSVRRDWVILTKISMVLFIASLLATVYFSPNRLPLNKMAKDVEKNTLRSGLGEVDATNIQDLL